MLDYKKIITTEKTNRSQINLYRDGDFFQAVEASAYAFKKYIWRDIKLLLRGDDKVGRFVLLGFPLTSLSKVATLVQKAKLTLEQDHPSEPQLITIVVPKISDQEYDQWHREISSRQKQAEAQLAPFYGALPVYKQVFDLFSIMVGQIRKFPKDLRFVLGDKIIAGIVDINHDFYDLAQKKTKEKTAAFMSLRYRIDQLQFLWRLAFEQRAIGLDTSVIVIERIGKIQEQLNKWQHKLNQVEKK